jgi:hypothetical protein
MRAKSIDVPIFCRTVHFHLSDDADAACLRATGERIDIVNDAGMTVLKDGDVYVFIFSHEGDEATVAHECLHAANYIIDLCGMQADACNDELQAYLMGWLVEQWYQMVRE